MPHTVVKVISVLELSEVERYGNDGAYYGDSAVGKHPMTLEEEDKIRSHECGR